MPAPITLPKLPARFLSPVWFTNHAKGLLWARQSGFLESRGDHLAYIDADCRIPPAWVDIVEREFGAAPELAAPERTGALL